MVLALYVGFSRLNHRRFVAQDSMLIGIVEVGKLPPQCTFWRFLTSLPVTVAQQLLKLQRRLRERVREAANLPLPRIRLDTDTTVNTLYGRQMGVRRSCNSENKGKKKSYQQSHLKAVLLSYQAVCNIYSRADAGFYYWNGVQAYDEGKASFIIADLNHIS